MIAAISKSKKPTANSKIIEFFSGEDFSITEAVTTIDNGDFDIHTIRFEMGQLARQADSSVTIYLDKETILLSTVTTSNQPCEGFDSFLLTVDVEECMYAVGKIPGSFSRREGRPSTDAILACRLIDCPLRPTFIKGLRNRAQVVVTVMSWDPRDRYDVVATNSASAATQLPGLPVSGAAGGAHIALVADNKHPEDAWVAFPTEEQHEQALFEMVVAGRIVTRKRRGKNAEDVAIMMVEAGIEGTVVKCIVDGTPAPTEDIVAVGLEAAKPHIKVLCEIQKGLAERAAKDTQEFPLLPAYSDEAFAVVKKKSAKKLAKLLTTAGKQERDDATNEYMEDIGGQPLERLVSDDVDEQAASKQIRAAHDAVMKWIVREKILTEGFRIDGRGVTDIRDLGVKVGLVPRVHDSSLFERGETQVLGVTTLGMLKMEQQIDSLTLVTSKCYTHHYSLPPYSTGETGRVGSPKRHEIGYGALVERVLLPVVPSYEEFLYTIHQVSEALRSNGSTSMGSVCASTLLLYNVGMPLKAPVVGIAMGLIPGEVDGENRFVVLTDILGAENAFGDVDFKIADTADFITALQLDIELGDIPSKALADALSQARDARLVILSTMTEVIESPDGMSGLAPKITTIKVPASKIGKLIGPKDKTTNDITEETGADISIEDDGTVFVSATSGKAADAVIEQINVIANPQLPKVSEHYLGAVVKIVAFGIFVSLTPGRDGLIHVSKLGGDKRIEKVEDVINVGGKIRAEIVNIDNRGKTSLVPVEENQRFTTVDVLYVVSANVTSDGMVRPSKA